MWDHAGRYPDVTAAHCVECRARGDCPDCPSPKLLDEAQPGVLAFACVSSQWRHAAMSGRRTGLAYADCLAALRERHAALAPATGPELTVDDLFTDVQVIEHALLGADHERALAAAAGGR